jgi:phenylpropionate dioxygenase-like ring-hydroxylating dioxygenase large terminal subunit
MEDIRSASQESTWNAWPRYRDAVTGFREYWYPVLASADLGRKPRAIKLCGEDIVLVRDRGRAYGLHDRCPHRGVKLSAGRREFPGLLTCAYHGWCYDLQSGDLAAALTDGPDSPICGKASVRVKTYPVEERAGVIWVYIGDGEPLVPVEEDIPEEILRPNAVVLTLFENRVGNWRYGLENAMDEGHAKYLHRRALWSLFSAFPAWTKGVRMEPSEDGRYLMRKREKSIMSDIYPRIGTWPPRQDPWRSPKRGPSISLGGRLPCICRVEQPGGWTDYEIFVPIDEAHYRATFLTVRWTSGLDALKWRLRYWTYIRPIYYGLLNRAEDQWMIAQMNIPPERLYRPDVSVTGWRKWCDEKARRAPAEATRAETAVQQGNGRSAASEPTEVASAATNS